MYPYHYLPYCTDPNCPDSYPYLNAYETESFYPGIQDERTLGQLFPQMGPPQGPPPGSPGFPPSFPGQGAEAGAPTTPPPSFVPAQTQQFGAFAVDPGSIRRCLFRFTYVWLRNFQQFWFYPIFVGRTSISGYRWTGNRWVFFGISLRQIESFTCV
jgi:hypothetical protein